MTADGPSRWTLASPSRDQVCQRMAHAIRRWDLTTKRNINYRYVIFYSIDSTILIFIPLKVQECNLGSYVKLIPITYHVTYN